MREPLDIIRLHRIYASLEALRTAVSELKAQSEASFSVATDMRGSLADVQELRGAVSEAMKSELH